MKKMLFVLLVVCSLEVACTCSGQEAGLEGKAIPAGNIPVSIRPGLLGDSGVSAADLATKLSTSDVVQVTGTSTTQVMSQNAVTEVTTLLESKVDGLINNGTFLYNCSTTNVVNTNYFNMCSTLNAKFSRTYAAPTNNQYVGDLMATQKFTRINGPAVMNIYLERVNSSPVAPAISVKPEIYFSYTGTNGWFGDYDTEAQAISTGTNLYTFVTHFPQQIATNTTGFYVRRALKVTSVNNANLVVHGGTGTPSSVSFTIPSPTVDTSAYMLTSGNTTNIILGLTNSADTVKMTYSGGILTFTEIYNGVTNTYNSLNN